MKWHKIKEHIGKTLKCDTCDQSFYENGYLEIHKKSKHQETRFSCKECDKSFTAAEMLLKSFRIM